jgi:hypothetical protein
VIARAVEPTMSVNRTVARTRLVSRGVARGCQEFLDLSDDRVGVAHGRQIILTGKLDELRLPDMLGQVRRMRFAALRASRVQSQPGRLDQSQQ